MLAVPLPSPSKFRPSSSSSTLNSPHQILPKPHEAHRINPKFDRLRSRLIDQANGGYIQSAVSTLDSILRHGLTPYPADFSLLLKSCVRTGNFRLGRLVHAKLAKSQLEVDSVLSNSLIDLYSKYGDWIRAFKVFEGMREKRDLVSWSAMIACFASSGLGLRAVETFIGMMDSGFYPNEFCFSAVIRACSSVETAWFGDSIFGLVLKTGHFDDLHVGCGLIDMFAKGCLDLGAAMKVFDKMPEKNAFIWSLMISRLAQMGCPETAFDLFPEMELSGHEPDRFTLTSLISACAQMKSFSMGKQLHSQVIRSGLISDPCVGCSLVDMYAKCSPRNPHLYARKVFDQMSDQNVMSWTSMITIYAENGLYDREAIELFIEMLKGSVAPNNLTFASVLRAFANLSDPSLGEQVHGHALKRGLAWDNSLGNSLISMYSQCNRIDEAQKVFDVLLDECLVSDNTKVDADARNQISGVAFELYHEIGRCGMGPNSFTFASLLAAAGSITAGSKGEQIHGRILKTDFQSDQRVCNALISMYARCGDIESAYRVFSKMVDRDTVSWTAMIAGFAKHGFARQALDLFDDMRDVNIEPNAITYVAVLSACSHVGLVSEGKKHFNAMYKDQGIVPTMDHYACMVDLLGRSGLLIEALELINSMPFKANSLVWRTLLGACQVHSSAEIGERAAREVLQLEPNDPSTYTLLSNLYASGNQWEAVARIRKDMKEKKLRKEAGCSWIESKNRLHKFYVGDTLHSQARRIYEELNQLVGRIKEMGYVPDKSCVLHKVEEERKEHYLMQHSEKIAVAFGLMSTPDSKPVRIFKNLRVCGDCHNAMKFISRATGREIVLRDSNRFHHFRDGSCSCNDYW